MDELNNKLTEIKDPRHQGYVKHPLVNILIIVMCATLSGLDQLCDIMQYANNKQNFLKKYFNIQEIPSKSTFSRVLDMIDGEAVVRIIIEIMQELVDKKGKLVAVDGKAIRQTYHDTKMKSALQIITAYCTESGVILDQKMIDSEDKTNEIPVFQEMLSGMNIEKKIITADAMHTQKTTCEKIIEKKGDYILGLKENQKNLYQEVKQFFEDENNQSKVKSAQTVENNKGRMEERTCYKTTNIASFSHAKEWTGIQTIIAIKRVTTTKDKVSEEISYYISSCKNSAKKFLKNIRSHWKIESMHWLLDVVFSEDDTVFYNQNAHNVLNIFRKLALLLHKKYVASLPKRISLKANMFNCLLTDETLVATLLC